MTLLWSMQVECPGSSYSTQYDAENPRTAVEALLAGGSISQRFKEDKTEHDGKFNSEDILYVIPMDGLDGMWLSQIGRSGVYVSVVLVNTIRASTKETQKDR